MYLTVKNSQHNLKIIRRFDEDIWGTLAILEKPCRVSNYIYDVYQNSYKHKRLLSRRFFFLNTKKTEFTYKVVSEEKEFKRKRRTMKKFIYLALLKLRRFYGNIGKKKFKQLFRQNTLHTNALGRSFAYFLESRLDVILYRSNLFNSIFEARQAINHKKIYVNGLLVNKPSFKIFINDIITISEILKYYKKLNQKLENNKILVNYPNYLEINYLLGIIVLIKMPNVIDIPFPFFMNLKNLTHGFIK